MMQDDDGGKLVEAIASVLDPYIDPAVCGQTRPVYIRDAVLEVFSSIEREGFKVVKKRDGEDAARWYVDNFPV